MVVDVKASSPPPVSQLVGGKQGHAACIMVVDVKASSPPPVY